MELGKEIKRLRLAHGYTQGQLGEMLGVQKSAVQKYEKGTIKNLKGETISRLCEIFNIAPSALFDVMYDTDDLSRRVRVLDELSLLYGNRSVELLELYTKLNQQGQAKIYSYAKDLSEMGKYNS